MVEEIELTCYETNDDIIPLLESNLEYMKQSARLKITTKIKNATGL
jgi:adenine-specific DNA-methyltransferase